MATKDRTPRGSPEKGLVPVTSRALQTGSWRGELRPWSGASERNLQLPVPTIQSILREEIEAEGDLQLNVTRDVLTGATLLRVRARRWLGQYRNAEIRLLGNKMGTTQVLSKADLRDEGRLSKVQRTFWTVLAAISGGYLYYLLPHPLDWCLAGVGVLGIGLSAFAKRDLDRRRAGFRAQMEGVFERAFERIDAIEDAPGQLSLTGEGGQGGLSRISRSRWSQASRANIGGYPESRGS